MHNPESVLENEMHKILRDFKIQTDHLIKARRPDLGIVKKKKKKKNKNLPKSGRFHPGTPQKKEKNRKRKQR